MNSDLWVLSRTNISTKIQKQNWFCLNRFFHWDRYRNLRGLLGAVSLFGVWRTTTNWQQYQMELVYSSHFWSNSDWGSWKNSHRNSRSDPQRIQIGNSYRGWRWKFWWDTLSHSSRIPRRLLVWFCAWIPVKISDKISGRAPCCIAYTVMESTNQR